MLNPDMPVDELRLMAGEMTAQEIRTARAFIRAANAKAEISMRAGQLASSDYKACGHTPGEMGVEILHIVKDATDKLPEHLKAK